MAAAAKRVSLSYAELETVRGALCARVAESNGILHDAVANPYMTGSVCEWALERRASALAVLRRVDPDVVQWAAGYRNGCS